MDIFSWLMGRGAGGGSGGGGDSGGEWKPIGDGNTHLWISLPEGRTSPMLGVCVNGTVTVDWGDGTTPDVLTGTNTHSTWWTPAHEYAKAGDYMITLITDGAIGLSGNGSANGGTNILRFSTTTDYRNNAYSASIRRVEMGSSCSFSNYGNAFNTCRSLESVYIPDGVKTMYDKTFYNCHNLESVNIPDSVIQIGDSTFENCYSLKNVNIPSGLTTGGKKMFYNCYSLTTVNIPDGFAKTGNLMFYDCYSLASVSVPSSVTFVAQSTFNGCRSLRYVDFTKHTKVPTLDMSNAFGGNPDDFEIRVPAALVDEWKAATNWATHADKIVGV